MQTFVTRNQFVRERQTGHHSATLQPEDRRKAAAKENTLDGRKGDYAFAEIRRFAADPLERPVGLLLNARQRFDRVEQEVAFVRIGDVRLDEQTVHFRVNILDGHLEAVETASLRHLHLLAEPFDQILVDDAVGRGEKGENVADEFALVRLQSVPVVQIAG